MDNYTLSNCVKKDLKKHFSEPEIKKRKMNLKWIKSLLNQYILHEYCESWYDKYEERCTWYDVEGLRYGWVWANRTVKDTDRIVKKMFLGQCKEFKKKCPNRNIFIGENDQYIWIVLPLRNLYKKDVDLILKK